MKKILFQFTLFLSLMTIMSCSSDLSNDSQYGSIAGSVSDKKTGEPVATVNVTLSPGGASTVTGSDGTFSFNNLEPGEYTIEISKDSYLKNSSVVIAQSASVSPAHLLIERIPDIVTADRDTLDFGDNETLNTLSFNIVNSSYEDLEWEIEERCEWITEVKPNKGTLAYSKTEGIVVVIDRNALNKGENKTVIVIRSSRGSTQMNVTAIGNGSETLLNVLPITDLTSNSVTYHAEIVSTVSLNFTERGFVYSQSSMPTLETTISKETCSLTSSKDFSKTVSGLKSNSTYYVRAYAKTNSKVFYSSNEVKFNTGRPLPRVSTIDVLNSDFSEGTATFVGEVTFVGEPEYFERGFVYGILPEPTINDNKVVANGVGETGKYSKYVTNLPKTTFYIRAYATSEEGTVYGNEIKVDCGWIELKNVGIAVQKEDLGYCDWETANIMCKNSTLGGYTDWRLPTKAELTYIYNNQEKIGGFTVQSGKDRSKYWTSTYYEGYGYYLINFVTGSTSADRYSLHSVRAVRTLTK